MRFIVGRRALLALLASAVFVPACSHRSAWAPPKVGAARTAAAAQSGNAFGLDLYARAASSRRGNFAMSPASIGLALTMTAGGARGETAAAMGRALRLQGNLDAAFETAGSFMYELVNDDSVSLAIANRLFAQRGTPFERGYLDKTRRVFGAPVEAQDFRDDADKARRQINAWVEDETGGHVGELFPSPLDRDTRLVLVNAVYFRGKWSAPFEANDTFEQEFEPSDGARVRVPTMHKRGELLGGAHEGARVLELPYQGGAFSMLFVLPDDRRGLAALESNLTAERLDALARSVRPQRGYVSLPKFEIKRAAVSLREPLEQMGMAIAFDRDRADFSGIANPPSADERLSISTVRHEAFVRVDEKGTEAAAATAVEVFAAGAAPAPPPFEFIADHPFVFVLRHRKTGAALFVGRVENPAT